MSLDSFVPEDQPAKLKLIEKAAKVLIRRSIRNRSMRRRRMRKTSSR